MNIDFADHINLCVVRCYYGVWTSVENFPAFSRAGSAGERLPLFDEDRASEVQPSEGWRRRSSATDDNRVVRLDGRIPLRTLS